MNFKFLKILELVVVILEFTFCLLTSVYCSYCLSDINTILTDADYKYYFADFKKKFQLFHSIEFSDSADNVKEDEILIGKYYNITCENTKTCETKIISSNLWKNKFININRSIEDNSNNLLNFVIISSQEQCPQNYNQCFKNEYYRTCIYFKLKCPITAILSEQTLEFGDEEKLFYNLDGKDTNKNQFINKGNFSEIPGSGSYQNLNSTSPLIFSSMASGIPIVGMIISYEQPCKLGYLIKSKIIIEHLTQNSNSENYDNSLYKLQVSILNCSNFKEFTKEIPTDSEGDYQLDTLLKDMTLNSFFNTSPNESPIPYPEIFDLRYIKVDAYSLENHLKMLKLIDSKDYLIIDQNSKDNLNVNLYIRKLFYAKDECTLDFYNFFTLLDVKNVAQIRVLLLRYLNWAAIDLIFLIFFAIYIRSFYLCKKIYLTKNRESLKYKQQTNVVDKYLHIFIVVIKLISALVAKFVYLNNDVQNDFGYYEECVTDAYTIKALKNIHSKIIDLKKSSNIIAFVTSITFIVDVGLTLYLHCRNRRKNLELKKRAKALK